MARAPKKIRARALILRQRGESYAYINGRLGIPKATLSGWFKGVSLHPQAHLRIAHRRKRNLAVQRKKALEKRRLVSQREEDLQYKKFQTELAYHLKPIVFEALLGMLYLGEGFKMRSVVGLGNSNIQIVRGFIVLLRKMYNVPDDRLRCYLYLRADQKPDTEVRFWSRQLGLKRSRFGKCQVDKRTLGKKTWKGYHGVCAVYCYDAQVEKRMSAIQNVLLETIQMGL